MNIAIFIKSTTFHKGSGGLESQNKVLSEGLVKRGHRVTIFSPAREIGDSVKEENGVRYIFIPCVYRMLFASADSNNWYNKSYETFRNVHKEYPFDAVISQSSAAIGIIGRKEKLGLKIIGISHGTIWGEIKTVINSINGVKSLVKASGALAFGITNYFGRQRQYIHGCTKIVAVSHAVKQSIINETFVEEKKVVVIHNGMDGNKILQKNWDATGKEPFKVLYLGRVEESKGLRELLEACRDLPVHLNIVGEGPFLERLKTLSREYKMSQKTLFYGKLPFDKVAQIYSCNNVFVLPTKRVEGFPMTLVEACFAGIPVITTNMGGNTDAVSNNINGIVMKELSIPELKDSITQLKENPELAKKMGLNGRMKAEREFSLEKMLTDYERILCES